MGRKTRVILQPVQFRKRNHIVIICPNNPEVDMLVREYEGAEWSTGYRFWHLPLNQETLKKLSSELKSVAVVDISSFDNFDYPEEPVEKPRRKRIKVEKPNDAQLKRLQDFKDSYEKKGYSIGTLKIYMCLLSVFFGWYKHKKDVEITNEDINTFLDEYIEANNFTTNYKRLMTNALRRYFDFIGHNELSKIS